MEVCSVCGNKLTGNQKTFCSVACGNRSFRSHQLWLKRYEAIKWLQENSRSTIVDYTLLTGRTLSLIMTDLGFKFKYNHWTKSD